MRFLQADENDKAEIMSLYRVAIGTEGCTWSMDYPNEEIFDMDCERGDLFCLKNDDGEITGAISVDDDEAVEALECWDSGLSPGAELARLVVKEEYRNQGIARRLLSSAMEILAERDYKSAHFLVSKTNYRAINSYAKLEFTKKGECDLYDGQWWCYEKEL